MKIDKRKKYYLVLDVETAGSLAKPLVYDLGLAICDRKGHIYEKRSFVITEIFSDKELMATAYYRDKIPLYLEGLHKGDFTPKKWVEAIQIMNNLAVKYNASYVSAYNLGFDMRALSITNLYMGIPGKVLDRRLAGIKPLCIWGLCCETLYLQKTFQRVAKRENWLTEKGNIRTSAEIGYRYISCDYDFIEAHTGLEDVEIEVQLLAQALRQNKKVSGGIVAHPWRIPNKK